MLFPDRASLSYLIKAKFFKRLFYCLNHFSDNKSYLTTVMENDLIKPWRQSQLPPMRVSVPKRVPDFVSHANEEPTTVSTVESPGIK